MESRRKTTFVFHIAFFRHSISGAKPNIQTNDTFSAKQVAPRIYILTVKIGKDVWQMNSM